MISQGYPLWAVNEDGTPFLVVGWEEIPTDGPWPVVVSLDAPQGVARSGLGESFTFTTTDPSTTPRVGTPSEPLIYGMTPVEAANAITRAIEFRDAIGEVLDLARQHGQPSVLVAEIARVMDR